ncbi:MAG: hypothetical protein DCC50_11075 [Acidobacteria bacterium]|nr:MAG: hypothetical protein DCC50_11075 [Acidobacteriota bacterium]
MDDTSRTQTTPTSTGTSTGATTGRGGPDRDPVLLSGTEHLLAALPHVLGYHPHRSIVLVATAAVSPRTPGRRHSVLTARLDLPPEEEAGVVLDAFAGPLAGVGAEHPGGLLLHVFVHDAPPQVAEAVAATVRTLAAGGGHVLHDLLLVREGRYLPLVADGLAQQPDAGDGTAWRPVPVPADVPGVADLVLRGRAVLPGRGDVVAAVRRQDLAAAADTQAALEDREAGDADAGTEDHLPALGRLSRWVVDGQEEPDAQARAAIVLALADRTLRDAVLARWLPALFSVEEVLTAGPARELRRRVRPWPAPDAAAALDRLLGIAAAVPRPVAAPLLTVAGVVAWGQGEGTIANEAVDLALEVDPGYRMALLVQAALERGVPPWRRSAHVA